MANYSSICGWLQVSSNMSIEIERIVRAFKPRALEYGLSSEQADLYLQGFLFQRQQINWSSFVFYGAEIQTSAIRFMEDLVKEIAETVLDRDGDYADYPRGLFHVDDENEDAMIVWLVAHGKFDKQTTPDPFAAQK